MRKAGDNRFIFDVVTFDITIENTIFSVATRRSGFPTKINDLDDILIRSRANVLLTLELKLSYYFALFQSKTVHLHLIAIRNDFNRNNRKKC